MQSFGRPECLPLAPPDLLSYLTTFTLRSQYPYSLGRLGIRHFGGLAGETACFYRYTVLCEFAAEKCTLRLLERTTLDFLTPIILLGAAENRMWTLVASLLRPKPNSDDEASAPTYSPCSGFIIILRVERLHPSSALSDFIINTE